MRRRVIFIVVLLSLAACDSAPSGVEVTRQQYGEEWPFTVESGRLDCDPVVKQAVLFKADGPIQEGGGVWALNGLAASRGYPKIDPIWRENPKTPGTKVSVSPMIELALKHCET